MMTPSGTGKYACLGRGCNFSGHKWNRVCEHMNHCAKYCQSLKEGLLPGNHDRDLALEKFRLQTAQREERRKKKPEQQEAPNNKVAFRNEIRTIRRGKQQEEQGPPKQGKKPKGPRRKWKGKSKSKNQRSPEKRAQPSAAQVDRKMIARTEKARAECVVGMQPKVQEKHKGPCISHQTGFVDPIQHKLATKLICSKERFGFSVPLVNIAFLYPSITMVKTKKCCKDTMMEERLSQSDWNLIEKEYHYRRISAGSSRGARKMLRKDCTWKPWAMRPPLVLTRHAKERLAERGPRTVPRFVAGTYRSLVATYVPDRSKKPKRKKYVRRARTQTEKAGKITNRAQKRKKKRKTRTRRNVMLACDFFKSGSACSLHKRGRELVQKFFTFVILYYVVSKEHQAKDNTTGNAPVDNHFS